MKSRKPTKAERAAHAAVMARLFPDTWGARPAPAVAELPRCPRCDVRGCESTHAGLYWFDADVYGSDG